MTLQSPEDALRHLLGALPQRLPVERMDRLWAFPVRALGARECGLVVISTLPDQEGDGPRRVLTLRYELERSRNGLVCSDALTEQGTAPADRIQRVIDGVIRRAGDEAGDPVTHEVGGDHERWAALLDSVAPPPAGAETDLAPLAGAEADPARSVSTKTDPARPAGAENDPARPAGAETDPARPAGTETDPARPAGAETDPARHAAAEADPARRS